MIDLEEAREKLLRLFIEGIYFFFPKEEVKTYQDLVETKIEAVELYQNNNSFHHLVQILTTATLSIFSPWYTELKQLREEAERFKSTLDDIAGICVNYDGYTTVEGLQGLIDDIGDMAARR